MRRKTKRPLLSLCMIALNEEDLIGECLQSVRGLVDEIIVGLDTRTTDRTGSIARGHGARIIPVKWGDDFSYARNLTLEAARGDWILILDADDRLTPRGAHAVRFMVGHPGDALLMGDGSGRRVAGYRLNIAETNLDGSPRGKPKYRSGRLFKRSADLRYSGIVHEEVFSVSDRSSTRWSKLPLGPHITHVGYDPDVEASKGRDARNMRLLERRLAHDPDDVDTHVYLKRQHSIGERFGLSVAHARRALESLARIDRTDAEFLELKAEMQSRVDEGDEMNRAILTALSEVPIPAQFGEAMASLVGGLNATREFGAGLTAGAGFSTDPSAGR